MNQVNGGFYELAVPRLCKLTELCFAVDRCRFFLEFLSRLSFLLKSMHKSSSPRLKTQESESFVWGSVIQLSQTLIQHLQRWSRREKYEEAIIKSTDETVSRTSSRRAEAPAAPPSALVLKPASRSSIGMTTRET